MSTSLADVVRQGYLRCKSRSMFGMWHKRWVVLRATSSKGPCRLEKHLDEKAARVDYFDFDLKVEMLTNVLSVVRMPSNYRKHCFAVTFADGHSRYFACDSDLEADNWVKLLLQECFVPSPGIANGEPDILGPGMLKEQQERFRVFLRPSPKIELYGECLLHVTHENIYLWDAVNAKIKLATWPLTSLRRYGSDQTKFTFEAGRHCPTGEGMFIFQTLDGEKIYRKVHLATVAIAEAHQKLRKENADVAAAVVVVGGGEQHGSEESPLYPAMYAHHHHHHQPARILPALADDQVLMPQHPPAWYDSNQTHTLSIHKDEDM